MEGLNMKNPYRNTYIRDLNIPRWPLFLRDAMKAVADFHRTIVIDGVPRWPSNNQVPPTDLLELWQYKGFPFDFEKAEATRSAETSAFIDEYVRINAVRKPSDEELFEMRAAFGPGTTVVNAVTGQRIKI
jgi:hypothetical protein